MEICNLLLWSVVNRQMPDMLRRRHIFPFICLLSMLILLTKCKKDHTSLSITLYDKPLNTIQSYTNGKWRMIYLVGGFAGSRQEADPNNYLILSPGRIVFGTDPFGIIMDTTIHWTRAPYNSDSTYLLDYLSSPDFPLVHAKIVDRIFNDTLILIDYSSSEPYYYHYVRK